MTRSRKKKQGLKTGNGETHVLRREFTTLTFIRVSAMYRFPDLNSNSYDDEIYNDEIFLGGYMRMHLLEDKKPLNRVAYM